MFKKVLPCWCAVNSAIKVLWELFQNLTIPLPPHDTKFAQPLAELLFLASRNSIFEMAQLYSF